MVWGTQDVIESRTWKYGRRGGKTTVTAVISALLLLIGLAVPVAAADDDAPGTPVIATIAPSNLQAIATWTIPDPTAFPAATFEVVIDPPIPASPLPATTSMSQALNGLTAGTAYTVEVTAVSADGARSDAGTKSFTTAPAATAPTEAPDDVELELSGSNRLRITWSLVSPANNGGEAITSYEYTLDNGGSWSSAGGSSATAFTTGVLPAGDYRARVRAVNGIGPGAASTPQTPTVTIPEPPVATVPTEAPDDVELQLSGSNRLRITWSLVAPANNGGQAITGYEYTLDNGGSWSSAGGPSATAFTTGVLPAGDYRARVRAVNGIGPGAASTPQTPTVTIPEPAPAAPGAPGTPTVTNSGSTINVAWSEADGVVDNYLVTLTRVGGTPQTRTVSGLSTSFGSQSPGDYSAVVRARNEAGGTNSPPSGSFTLTLAASAVRNVNAAVDAANTVVVTWAAPTDDGGGVVSYEISITGPESRSASVPGSVEQASFSGLPSGDYEVSVVAKNVAGDGAAGSDTFSIVVQPGSPLNVKTTAPSSTNGTATVTWDPPANNGNGTISSYKVSMGGITLDPIPAGNPRTASFTGLPIGKLVATVVAVNAQGDSPAGSSPEFFSKRPVHPFATREAFARQTFIDLFGVAATPGEFTEIAAATAADGSNAPAVITNLMRGDRFENRRQVSRLYFAYFQRVPDASGQKYWTDLMDRGVLDLQGVSDEFARSPEFINTYGGLNEAEFLVVVYNNVLLRTPDVVGFNYWLGERNRGLTRGGVMTWFTEGNEYIALSLPAIDTSLAHIYLLGRSPSTGEYALWVTRIRNTNNSVETLIASIWVSDEYAARITPS